MTDNKVSTQPAASVADASAAGVQNGARQPQRRRWLWLPTLLFGDGLMLSVILTVVVMLHRFGRNNAQTALCISLLCLPFLLRPVFEMVVAYFRGTTKVWVLSAEFISALSLWALAFTLPTGYWFQGVMCFLPFFVMSGMFGNIAVERFYLKESGVRTRGQNMLVAVFRGIAMLFGVGIVSMFAGNMEVLTRNVRYSWSLAFYILAGVEFMLWLWHSIVLPGGRHIYAGEKDLFGLDANEYSRVADAVVHGWRNRFMLYFFAVFALPEAFMAIMVPLFVVDAPHNGGLGLAPQEFGLAFGTVGIIAMFMGCVLGADVIRRFGMLRCIVPMSLAAAVHGGAMLYLSYNFAVSLAIASALLFVGGVACGIVTAVFFAAVERFAANKGAVLRRSIALALLALSVVATGMFAGMLQTDIGYRQFFIVVVGTCAATVVAAVMYVAARRNTVA